jgi:membrane protein required for colicin V production
MALDIIGITLIIIFFIRGYMKGIIVAAFALLAIVLGIICSLKLSKELADWLAEKHIVTSGWAQVLSFVVLFIGVLFLVRLVAKALETSAKALMLGWVNGGMGGVLYAFLAALIWSSALWMLVQLNSLSPETIASSKTYKYFAPVAPWTFEKIGAVWPMVKGLIADVQQLFADINKPHDVGTPR